MQETSAYNKFTSSLLLHVPILVALLPLSIALIDPQVTLSQAFIILGIYSCVCFLTGGAICVSARINLKTHPVAAFSILFLSSQICLGFFALCSFFSGSILSGALITMLCLLAFAAWRTQQLTPSDERTLMASPNSALSIVLFSICYTVLSALIPLKYFSQASLVREMFSDGFQRFGVIHSLASATPPMNPFANGLPLSYYWFSFIPHSAMLALNVADTFVIWKCIESFLCFALVIALWWAICELSESKAVAWVCTLLLFAFPSYEIFANNYFWQQLSLYSTGQLASIKEFIKSLSLQDPDHILGVLTPYSDQLLLEDHLYIPQNLVATLLVVFALVSLKRKQLLLSTIAVSTIAGVNTFVLLPAAMSYSAALLLLFNFPLALFHSLVLLAFSALWLSVCGIIPVPPGAVLLVSLFLIFAGRLVLPKNIASRQPKHCYFVIRCVCFLLTICVGLTLITKPHIAEIYIWNYGLSFVGLLSCLILFSAGRIKNAVNDSTFAFSIFFLLFHLIITVLFVALVQGHYPDLMSEFVEGLGARLSPFNYYHKAGKVARVLMVLLAVMIWAPQFRAKLNRRNLRSLKLQSVLSYLVLVSILLPATVTPIVRAISYAKPNVPVELELAKELERLGANTKTVILLEDFRNSQLPQLLPISVYYYSSWTGAVNGLSHLSGTWAEQYVPKRFVTEISNRERLQTELFAAENPYEVLLKVIKDNPLDFIITKQQYQFEPCAELAYQASSGDLLYRVLARCKPDEHN